MTYWAKPKSWNFLTTVSWYDHCESACVSESLSQMLHRSRLPIDYSYADWQWHAAHLLLTFSCSLMRFVIRNYRHRLQSSPFLTCCPTCSSCASWAQRFCFYWYRQWGWFRKTRAACSRSGRSFLRAKRLLWFCLDAHQAPSLHYPSHAWWSTDFQRNL